MNEQTPKNRHRYCFVNIVIQNPIVYPSRTSRNTYWIGDLFTRVKSVKHMVKSKTKSISSLGAFSNFSKTASSIYNFLKIPAAAVCFVMERGRRKSQQNSRICVRAQVKLVYPVRNLSDSSKSLDDRQMSHIKGTCRCRQSRFLFPYSSRKDRSDSATLLCDSALFMNDWKHTAKRLKLQETTNNQQKKCNSVKHLQRQ